MKNTALLFVDIQKDFWDPYKNLPEYRDFPENIKHLRTYAAEQDIPVIHVRSLFSKDRSDWMLFYRPEGRGTIPCITGTPGSEFTDFAQPQENETVFTKQVFDTFNGTLIKQHLKEHNINTLLTSGIETSVCVLFTATTAYMNHILPIIITDACADTPKRHKKTLEMYSDLCFKTVTTDEIVTEVRVPDLISRFAK